MENNTDPSLAMQVQTRPMLPSDLDSVLRIEERSFDHPWTRDQFTAEMEHVSVSLCRVAVECVEDLDGLVTESLPEAKVVGFIMTWLIVDELHITNIAVAPEYRRRGVAAALLNDSMLEGSKQGATWCQLDVRISNAPAIALYRRFGFKPLGRRKGYYYNGEDAVVMGKDLEDSV